LETIFCRSLFLISYPLLRLAKLTLTICSNTYTYTHFASWRWNRNVNNLYKSRAWVCKKMRHQVEDVTFVTYSDDTLYTKPVSLKQSLKFSHPANEIILFYYLLAA